MTQPHVPDFFRMQAHSSDRAQAGRGDPLRRAVRRALPFSSGVLAAGLIFGAAPNASCDPFPAIFPLATLLPAGGGDGSDGFALFGIDTRDFAGGAQAAGDVNGDGIGDLVVGIPLANPGGRISAGEIYVVFGRYTAATGNFPPRYPLASLLPAGGGNGSAGFVLTGIAEYDDAGGQAKAAGDVNGDGIEDLIIGADDARNTGLRAGECYVVFGRDTAGSGNFPVVFPLETLLPANGGDGGTGFVLAGLGPGDANGLSVSAAGDMNGDGIDDLLIGAFFASPRGRSGAGQTFVVFGRDTARTGNFPPLFVLEELLPANDGDGTAGFVVSGLESDDNSGQTLSAAGDVNGDGVDDIIIGAPTASPGGRDLAGEGYVVFGRDTARTGNFPANLPLASLLPAGGGDGSAGFVLTGIRDFDWAGRSVSAGDFNSDGINDVLIGTLFGDPGGRSDAGQTFIVYGRDTARLGNFPALFPLATLLPPDGGDGSAGFVLNGVDVGDESTSGSAAGDLNGDGISDLVIGARYADPGGRSRAGQSYVVFGRDAAQSGNFPVRYPLATLLPAGGGDGSAGFVVSGIDISDEAGTNVGAAGDVNGDGVDDLIIGSSDADHGGRTDAGESYIVFGRRAVR